MANDTDIGWMRAAMDQAELARQAGEVPIGAVVVLDSAIVSRAHNRTVTDRDPTAHAEIVALREAARLVGNHRLVGAALYVTIEPCAMCAGAIVQARIARLVYGCDDPKAGAVRSLFEIADDPRLNHRAVIERGVLADECAAQVRSFFQQKREEARERG